MADARIWGGLQTRLGLDGWTLAEEPIHEKGVTGMLHVAEPCGSAASSLPATPPIVRRPAPRPEPRPHDVSLLAEALVSWHRAEVANFSIPLRRMPPPGLARGHFRGG